MRGATLFIVVAGHEKVEIEEIVDRQDAYYIFADRLLQTMYDVAYAVAAECGKAGH